MSTFDFTDTHGLWAIEPIITATGKETYKIKIQDEKLTIINEKGKDPVCSLSFQISSGKVPAGSPGPFRNEDLQKMDFDKDQQFVKIPIKKIQAIFSISISQIVPTCTEGDPLKPPHFTLEFTLPGAILPVLAEPEKPE